MCRTRGALGLKQFATPSAVGSGGNRPPAGWHGLFPRDVDDAAKHRLLAAADVHLMPTRKEGWGLAVIEAAQHGGALAGGQLLVVGHGGGVCGGS